MFDPNATYTVDYPQGARKKTGCRYITRIPRGVSLTDDQVRMYFNINEDHKYWHTMHLPRAHPRLVFDRCAFSENLLTDGLVSVTLETE